MYKDNFFYWVEYNGIWQIAQYNSYLNEFLFCGGEQGVKEFELSNIDKNEIVRK